MPEGFATNSPQYTSSSDQDLELNTEIKVYKYQLQSQTASWSLQLNPYTDLVMFSDAEKHRDKECLAAIAIQTNWRMLRVKWNFEKKVRACRTIERVFRGHTGRLQFYSKKEDVFRQR